MGLDNIFSGSVPGDFNVCGGMFSGHGNESFRGKVYADLVQEISGLSLYYDLLADEVEEIADALEEHLKEGEESDVVKGALESGDYSRKELLGLAAMFRAHADAGHSLRAWA